MDRTVASAVGTGGLLVASCNYNNNTKSFVPGATSINSTGTTGQPATAALAGSNTSKWPKRPTAVTSATSRPSRITKMMNRLRRPRSGGRKNTVKIMEADNSSSFLNDDDDEEEDTTTCGGGNEFVSTATVTFALSTVYCVDCDDEQREPGAGLEP